MSTSHSPRKTFVDYAAIAVCPALIILLVGSLIFFLLAIGYVGSHLGELRWTFFWFVLAMVLVSRIAIEKGSEHAGIYGLCLAAATGFMLLQYLAFSLWIWGLLGLIWWATNKLTWDCTLIDEDQDASGEGLLQAARLDPQDQEPGVAPPPSAPMPPKLDRTAPPKKQLPKVPSRERKPAKPSAAKQPHAPGLWVIYFSLGALPIFGLGQGLIAKQDVAARRYAFCLLAIYLGTALGLLLITSFLGLRRYLRQRYLQMPPAMAATWLTTGTMLALAILLGCLLVPRPSAYWSLTAMLDRLGDPVQKQAPSSKPRTQMPGGETKPEGEKSGPQSTAQSGGSASETAQDAPPPSPSERPATARPDNQSVSESAPAEGTNGQGKQGAMGRNADRTEPAQVSPRATGESEPAAATRPTSALPLRTPLKLLRLAIYAALLALGLVALIRNRDRLGRLLLEFWFALQELWHSLFARKATAPVGTPATPCTPRRPFAALTNPFASGAAMQMSPEDLIIHSFQGLEAWAEEHHCRRHPDQTPFEFADCVAAEVPDLAHEAQQVARLYVQVAYAKAAVLPACRTMLEIFWSKMTQGVR